MTAYESNISITDLAKKVCSAQRLVVTTHAKPDGDAYGSSVALAAAARGLGVDARVVLMPPVPANFASLRGYELTVQDGPDQALEDVDLVVLVDTGAWSQVAPMRARLERVLDRTAIVDHHIVGDVPSAWRYIDKRAAACCEVVASLITRMQHTPGGPPSDLFTPTVCEALFVGLASDTGWFRFSNTRSQSHELAADLIRRGVDHADLFRRLEQTDRPEKLALVIRALDSLKLVADERVALMVLRAQDFMETGAMVEETERLVDLPQAVASVQVVVLLTEVPPSGDHPPGESVTRMSFRSKSGDQAVNVAKLAQQFGGGGHALAAGAKVAAPVDEVLERVRAAVVELMGAPAVSGS